MDVRTTGTIPTVVVISWVGCIVQLYTIHLVQRGVMWDEDCHILVWWEMTECDVGS